MSTGTVKFYNDLKGWGFITPDDGDKDLFVHQSGVQRGHLREGSKVEFETESSPKGPNAVQVVVLDDE